METTEGSALTVQSLAGGTMAVFRIQRLFPAQLIFDSAAMAGPLVTGVEVRVVFVYFVRRALFPIVKTHSCG